MTEELVTAVEAAMERVLKAHIASPWHDSETAAEYISCTAGTLKTWRARGEGPRYHIINQKLIRYHISDLDAFVRGEAAK